MAYKVFQNGTALTAEVMNDFIQEQTIARFANAAERNTAIPAPEVGQHCYLTSTNQTLRYEGAGGWVELISAQVSGLNQRTIVQCTSTTRPSHAAGRMIFETDTRREYISDATKWILIGGAIPSVAVVKNVQTNLTMQNWTALPFELVLTSETNTPTMWSSSTPTRLTAPVEGIYLASGSVAFITPTGGSSHRYLAMRRNGGPLRRVASGYVNPGEEFEMNGTLSFRLAAGDYVELMYFTGFNGDQTKQVANPSENNPGFSLTFVGGI